ncbi:MAG: hypothetical protein COU51_04135 [Parcubacteria group bacterium CG10_big_fil_rev_8_21_14_0_10_36_14]|nr:MAG: hypothetical protein COU51_04135 [Parcubacteria group bacterium CG10_big_fil_rev_8_21_14_0_10_36_14]
MLKIIIEKHKKKLLACAVLFIIGILSANLFFLGIYIRNNKNILIFDSAVQYLLPVYRFMRKSYNNAINTFYLPKTIGASEIPHYKLTIKKNQLEKLNKNLPESISDAVFSGSVFLEDEYKKTVPAIFSYGDKKYEVEVHYRGDNPNHWTKEKKSWQIIFSQENLFNGQEVLKLILPIDRGYLAEALNAYRAKKMGLLVPADNFVNLEINKKNAGVYYQVEDWSKGFLEKQQVPADSSIYTTNDGLISLRKEENRQDTSAFEDINLWKKNISDKLFTYNNFSDIKKLVEILQSQNKDEAYKILPQILDMEKFYSWTNVALLVSGGHQGGKGNMRLYFNNSSGKFEPIPWDVTIRDSDALFEDWQSIINNFIYSNKKLFFEQKKSLWNYLSNEDNLKDDLSFYDKLYETTRPAFYDDWIKVDNNLTFDKKIKEMRDIIKNRFSNLKDLYKIDNSSMIINYDSDINLITATTKADNFAGIMLKSLKLPTDDNMFVEAFDDSNNNLKLDKDDKIIKTGYINKNDNTIKDINKLIYDKDEVAIFIKIIPYGTQQNGLNLKNVKIKFDNAITKKDIDIKSIVLSDDTSFNYLPKTIYSPRQFVNENPIFKTDGEKIFLPAGSYTITKNIIIPQKSQLIIQPGVVLTFYPKISLISYSPVSAIGYSDSPIIFQSAYQGQPWGSFGIVNTEKEKNKLQFINISGGGSSYINGIFFSGMLSAYHADLELSDSLIQNSSSDDGANAKYGNVVIKNNRFIKNSADGLDIDYAKGEISNNYFSSNGNDGIDISGSSISIKNNTILASGDKCISVGENSKEPVIFNNILNGCNIGIESKDLSTPVILNNVIINNNIGINAYRKKEIFGGGFGKIYNNIIWDNKENIKTDEYSQFEADYNDIETNYSGEYNFYEEPSENYYKPGLENYHGKGNRDILKKYLEINLEEAPVGLM